MVSQKEGESDKGQAGNEVLSVASFQNKRRVCFHSARHPVIPEAYRKRQLYRQNRRPEAPNHSNRGRKVQHA